MKFYVNNPAFLQGGGNRGKTARLFYITSNVDDNEITFTDTKLGAFADHVQYSVDNEQTWNQLSIDTIINLNNGATVFFRNADGYVYESVMGTKIANVADLYSIGGDVIDLFYPNSTLPTEAFANAFLEDAKIIDASQLVLKAKILVEGCYASMFAGCSSLTVAPELPATTLAPSCYALMFGECDNLTTAPIIQATDLAASCCSEMFAGCSSLTVAPELPATTLAESCYETMFARCSSLTVVPELPATTLANYCYNGMFAECNNLKEVRCRAKIFADDSTSGWLTNVAVSGTFTKAAGVEWPTGDSGIPEGWTVIEQ